MNDYLELLRHTFGTLYLQKDDVWTADSAMRRAAEIVMGLIPNPQSRSLLDIGAGRAPDAQKMVELGLKYFALDIVENEEWARLRCLHPHNFDSWAGSFFNFEPHRKYDVIFDNGCLHHQELLLLGAYIQNILKLMAPEALVALNVYTPRDPTAQGQTQVFADGRFAHVWNLLQVSEFMQPFGLHLHHTERIPLTNGKNFYLLTVWKKEK
jgi:hypothetical protein